MTYKRTTGLLSATAVALVLAATPAFAAEVVIAQSTDAVSLDPAFRADTASGNVQRHIFDTILFRNADMEIEPRLAERVERVGPTEWRIVLREGLTFSNGEPLDAEAVKFSIERLQDAELQGPTRSWWTGFTAVDVEDARTLTITTEEVDPLFEARMTLLAPVPPSYLAEVGNGTFAQEPVSSGPYKLVEWRRDEAVRLTANPDYWGEAPTIEDVTFRVVPEELSRVAALQTGEADVVAGLSPLQAVALEGTAEVKVERAPGTRVMAVQFDTDEAPANAQAFREAVAYGIDREAIIKGLLRGYASSVNSALSPGIPGWPRDEVFAKSYDPERAKALVEENGLGDMPIVMRSPSGRYPFDRETAQAVSGQLKEIGLDVTVQPDEWGVFFDDLKAGSMSPVYIMGQGNVWLDPYPQLDAFQRGGGFLSTWADPELDAMLDESSDVDGEARADVFRRALQRIDETTAVVPLYAQEDLYGVRERIEWTPRPDGQIFAFEMVADE